MTFRMARLMVLSMAVLAMAAPSSAQVYTGRIDVTVTDATGAILPNVTVVLSGPQNATAVSDAKGEVHFLNLAPGAYTVTARLDGFNEYSNTNVPVVAGGVVPLRAALTIAGVATQVDVTAATPTIDPKKLTTSTNVTVEELQNIPSSRDPWVVLQTVPGIIVDRVNVGGAESGQQSNYQAKGAAGGDNTWTIDGVPITDMAALGSSPTYYDFDMFQEMQVTTGGVDLANATPGVALNFVLKAGSNTPHGSTRIYYEDEGMQSNNLPDDLKATLGGVTGKGNRINKYVDYGFELGGPVLRDRLWAWGSLGKTDVTLLTIQNQPDRTILENASFKATGQATDNIRAGYTFFRGDKKKFGRGAGTTRSQETTWNQTGPSPVHKVEGNFVLGNNTFITGRYGYVGGGFQLAPQAGLDAQWFEDDAGVNRGSFYQYETVRPQWTTAVEGNHFRGRHEIKFGFGWRRADVDSTTTVPGNGIITYHDGYPSMYAGVTAWGHTTAVKGVYTHGYVGDTMTWDRLTLNAGLRWDRQASSVNPLTVSGNPLLANLLPDLSGTAADDVIVWNSVTPRIGLSYALDDARKTLLRGSYGMFASQLNATTGGFMSVANARGVYFYDIIDTNGNRVADPSEIAGLAPGFSYGFDINNPSNVAAPIHTVGDYSTPITHELQFGLDRELMANFGISGTFTWRQFTNFNWRNRGLVGTDYQQIDTFTGSHPAIGTFSVPIYGVIPGRIPANISATIYRDQEGYSQRYLGFEVAATKRLSNRWMARFGFSTNDHREYFDSPAALTDPTPGVTSPNKDGGLVVRSSGGSGKSQIYMVLPQYQFIATGLYQAPWGINVAANMVNRQGFARNYFQTSVPTPGDGIVSRKTLSLVADDVGGLRLPAVTSLDFRIGKEFAFMNRARIALDVDIFNLLNASTVLGRQFDLNSTVADTVREIMNPRVLRLGVRFNF
jgi:hypothetical protein